MEPPQSNASATSNSPSGDYVPVLATNLGLDRLASRKQLYTFRARDDLDWFTGAVVSLPEIGDVHISRYDNAPSGLTVFYVDSAVANEHVQNRLVEEFSLAPEEVLWRREFEVQE